MGHTVLIGGRASKSNFVPRVLSTEIETKPPYKIPQNMVWNCAICCCFAALQLCILLTHINTRHSAEDLNIVCGIEECRRTFQKANTFVRHVREKHHSFLKSPDPSDASCEGNWCDLNIGDHDKDGDSSSLSETVESADDMDAYADPSYFEASRDQEGDSSSDNESEESSKSENVTGTALQQKALNYLVKIKEENRIPQRTVENIAFATSRLFQGALLNLRRNLAQTLRNADVVMEDIPGATDCFEELSDCFDGLEKGWLPSDAKLPCVDPREVVLGKKRVIAKRNNKRRIVERSEVFYYVSILKTIEMQLSGSKKLFSMVYNSFLLPRNGHEMEDFSDGTFVSIHPLFAIDDRSLKILLYYDDVNVANPLTNKMHKIGFFYYQLANICNKYRSKLKSIHLFATCNVNYIKKYGMDKILEPLVEDLKVLSSDSGYPFEIAGGKVYLRGSVLAVLADTPASQALGGYKESVGGARRKCRHCMTDWESMQQYFTEEEFMLRDSDWHEQQLHDIENAGSPFLEKYFSKQYGINRRSLLCNLPDFDVTKQLPQDIMHIFLEGILSYELKFLLKHYFDAGLFTLEKLNTKLKNFNYGYSNVKDKPSFIKQDDMDFKSDSNLGQNAAQMWELSRIIPLILEDITDSESPQWSCFISLLEIMGICFAQKITLSSILNLKRIVKEHLSLFKETYGARILPKQHYLVHLPTQMMMFGPLLRTWCMRFEAKHAYFKDIVRRLKNFKNLPLTLAKRHQQMECADMLTVDEDDPCSLFKDDFRLGNSRPLAGRRQEDAKTLITRFYEIDLTEFAMFEAKSVVVHGTKYVCGDNNYLLLGLNEHGLPEFGKILKIWYALQIQDPFFVTKVMECEQYCDRLVAYKISEPDVPQGNQVTQHTHLYRHQVFHANNINGSLHIAMKENILAST